LKEGLKGEIDDMADEANPALFRVEIDLVFFIINSRWLDGYRVTDLALKNTTNRSLTDKCGYLSDKR
jgi:hypothetical protein